jgi:L-fuconolactonase
MATLAGLVPGIIDAHIHQWDPFTTPRETSRLAPLYRRAPGLVTRLLPLLASRAKRDLVLTAEHVGTPYLPSTYAADAAGVVDAVGVPVEAVIHVEAGWTGDPVGETAWVESLPFGLYGAPRLAAVVAHADPRSPDFAAELDRHLAASDRLRGVRLSAAYHQDPKVIRFADTPGLLRDPGFLRGFAALAERRLTFDAWLYSTQLDDVAVLAREYPTTTIVLDHFGTPAGAFGPLGRRTGRTDAERAGILAAWRDSVAAVAACPNVVAKQSGIAFPLLGLRNTGIGRDDLAALAAPLVEHTADCFGPDRLLFGSNFPMDKAVTTLPTVVGALVDLLAPRGPEVLAKVFRENAIRVYAL